MNYFKNILIVIAVATFASTVKSQNLLEENWKFIIGDNPAYVQPDFNDAAWQKIKVGIAIETQGNPEFSGFGWYRCTLIIKSDYKAQAKKYGGFTLYLATIDDCDQTYFNGTLVGSMGQLPPQFETAWDKLRAYTIPYDLIQWDKPNVIAVRLYDGTGNAGIIGEQIALSVKGLSENIVVAPEFANIDQMITNQTVVKIPVKISNQSDELINGKLAIKIKNEFHKEIITQSKGISLKGKSDSIVSIALNGLVPGFYQATVTIDCPITYKWSMFRFGVDPEKLTSHASGTPIDLKKFWDQAKYDLSLINPNYKLTHIDSFSMGAKDVYLLEMRSLGNVLIRGWYLVPKTKGPHPAILTVQGYSTFQQYTWTLPDDRFANLVLNIRGHGNSKDDINPGFPGFLLSGIEDKNKYIYRGTYMDCVRAIDFLFTRPEIDTTRVIVEGSSQGGALSFVTAALCNNRIRLCLPDVPFLSDFKDYFKVADWPANEFTEYESKHPEFGWDSIYNTLSYFDIRNLAPWIKAPVHMSACLLDVTCPLHINFAAYNKLSVPREYTIFPNSGHQLPRENATIKIKWIRKQLGMPD